MLEEQTDLPERLDIAFFRERRFGHHLLAHGEQLRRIMNDAASYHAVNPGDVPDVAQRVSVLLRTVVNAMGEAPAVE